MRTHPPAHRALDVVAGFTIYRVIGRRPSGVYVDSSMRVTTDMRDAQLRDVNFQYADLQFADFRGAHLVGVDFSTAVVRDADFRGATFENCKFRRTGTQGALFDEGVDLKAMSVGGDD